MSELYLYESLALTCCRDNHTMDFKKLYQEIILRLLPLILGANEICKEDGKPGSCHGEYSYSKCVCICHKVNGALE